MIDYFKKIAEYYRPSVPIDNPELFFGRIAEKSLLYRTLISPGRHALIYGARGIGKTSLTNIVTKVYKVENDHKIITHVCSRDDNFLSIVFSVLNTAQLNFETISETRKKEGKITGDFKIPWIGKIGISTEANIETAETKNKLFDTQLTPNFFANLVAKYDLVIVLDEFERIKDTKTLNLIAETLKTFSDSNSQTKFVIAGVGNSSTDLFGKHLSLPRSLVNIQVPLMSDEELKDIVLYGAKRLSLVFEKELVELIVWLSNGLPYFTHLLSEELAVHVLVEKQKEKVITFEHFREIILNVLKTRHYDVINYEYENLINQQREYSIANQYFGDYVHSTQYPQWLNKIVLQSFSLVCHVEDNLKNKVVEIVKRYYPIYSTKKEVKDLSGEDIENILLYFTNMDDALIQVDSNNKFAFKDNFYTTFVRLKALGEIEAEGLIAHVVPSLQIAM